MVENQKFLMISTQDLKTSHKNKLGFYNIRKNA